MKINRSRHIIHVTSSEAQTAPPQSRSHFLRVLSCCSFGAAASIGVHTPTVYRNSLQKKPLASLGFFLNFFKKIPPYTNTGSRPRRHLFAKGTAVRPRGRFLCIHCFGGERTLRKEAHNRVFTFVFTLKDGQYAYPRPKEQRQEQHHRSLDFYIYAKYLLSACNTPLFSLPTAYRPRFPHFDTSQ